MSATPGKYELSVSDGYVELVIIRPTGLVDPEIVVALLTKNQVDDLIDENGVRVARQERKITLTKRMAEELTDFWFNANIRVQYLHSDVDTLRRVELLRELRLGEFDVLVGI